MIFGSIRNQHGGRKMSEIGELVKRNDLEGLMELFHLTDWNGKESVVVGLRYIFDNGKYSNKKMIECLTEVLESCGSESHSYANNCRHIAKKMLMELGYIKKPVDNKAKRDELAQILKLEKHAMIYDRIKKFIHKGTLNVPFVCSSRSCSEKYYFKNLILTEKGFFCKSCGSPIEVYKSHLDGITVGMLKWLEDYISCRLSASYKSDYDNEKIFYYDWEKEEKQKSAGCFIATAAYGSENESEVIFLKQYRDQRLLTSFMGSILVHCYYFFSPPIATLISKSFALRTFTKKFVIKPTICILKIFCPFDGEDVKNM